MKPIFPAALLACALIGAGSTSAWAQASPDTSVVKADPGAAAPAPAAVTPPPASPPPPAPAAAPPPAKSAPNDRIYYGGTVTLSFSGVTRIGVYPMIGYKLTPKLSAGVEAGYEWVDYDNGPSTSNYGGSVFGRLRVSPNLYAHGEYQAVNYELPTGLNSTDRQWVPFLLVGAGYTRSLGGRTSVYAEVLFDVLQDENSPYDDWEPVVSVGVGVGF